MEENYKLAKWLEGTMTNDELAAFKADPDYLLYEKIKFQTSQLKTPDFDKENMLKSILKSDKSKPKIISLYKNWFYKVAAVFAIVLGIAYVFTSNSSEIQVTFQQGLESEAEEFFKEIQEIFSPLIKHFWWHKLERRSAAA